MPEALLQLGATLAPDGTIFDPSMLQAYEVGGRRPVAALFPSNAEDAALALQASREDGLPVTPWGSGSRQHYGHPPVEGFVVAGTRKLSSIIDFDPENLTVTAGAGASLASVQDTVRSAGLKVPLDPPAAGSATIGGVLACGSSGPRRLLYGSPRDLTLGVRVALPSGEVIRAGGKTVKNVAGYDLTKLFVGSLGTLGLIIEASLKLRALPEEERTLVAWFRTLGESEGIVRRILASSQLAPAALELLNASATAQASGSSGTDNPAAIPQCLNVGAVLEPPLQPTQSIPAPLEAGEGCLLIIAVEGFHEEVDAQSSRLMELGPFQELREAEGIWHMLSDGLPGDVTARVGIPLAGVVPFIERLDAMASSMGIDCPTAAQAGTGIVRLSPRRKQESLVRLAEFLQQTRSMAVRSGGYLVLENGLAEIRARVGTWGDTATSFQTMKSVKAVFDPVGIMNRGRFLGGI